MSGEPELHEGVSSEWVQHLQQVLARHGYWHGADDGAFDGELAEAVRRLQASAGLPESGIVDGATWEAVEYLEHSTGSSAHHATHTADGRPVLRMGISSEWVQHLQEQLAHAGYWHGAADGAFDDTLAQAVAAFQTAYGLTADGVVGAATWHALDTAPPAPADHSAEHSDGRYPILRSGTCDEWVGYLQQVLQHRGRWAGPLDSTFDDALAAVVAQVQGEAGLAATGVVDGATWTAIEGLPVPADPPAEEAPAEARPVAEMTDTEKLIAAYERADIDHAVRERIAAMFTPEALVTAIASFAVLFVAAQFTPAGWAADLALVLTAALAGAAVLNTARYLLAFYDAVDATSEADLDRAGHAFALAVAEIGVDAVLILLTRRAGSGGAPLSGPPGGTVLLAAAPSGELVLVAAETIPASVATELGLGAGSVAMTMGSGGGDDDHWDREYGDHPDERRPRRERISDGNKTELEDSGWLRQRLPDAEHRRRFMRWLQRGHEVGEEHVHLRPGSREADQAVQQFIEEEL